MLQDLLDLAKADSGYLRFQMKFYVLNDLVEEVVAMAAKYSDYFNRKYIGGSLVIFGIFLSQVGVRNSSR